MMISAIDGCNACGHSPDATPMGNMNTKHDHHNTNFKAPEATSTRQCQLFARSRSHRQAQIGPRCAASQYQRQTRTNSLQMPSMITPALARNDNQLPQLLDCKSATMASRPTTTTKIATSTTTTTKLTSTMGACASRCGHHHHSHRTRPWLPFRMRPSRLLSGGACGGSWSSRAIVITLIHQIVIISLILHKFPPLGLVGQTTGLVEAAASSSKTHNIGEGAKDSMGRHLSVSDNLHNLNHQPAPSSIYNGNERENDRRRGHQLLTSAAQANIGEPQSSSEQQQQTKAAATMLLLMMMGDEEAAVARAEDDENNQRLANQRGPLSFMDGEIMNELEDEDKQLKAARTGSSAIRVAANQQAAIDKRNYLEERLKRHMELVPPLAAAGGTSGGGGDGGADAAPVATLATTTTANQEAPSQAVASLDCHKLAALWVYLQSRYPTLSSHLVDLAEAAAAAAKQAANGELQSAQHQSAKSIQFARSIGHLLDDAERITATGARLEQLQQTSSTNNNNKQPHNHHRHSPAWLSRVYSNPTYGKLVQHLRAKQRPLNHQPPQQQQPRPSSSSSSSGVVPNWSQREETNASGNGSGRQQQPPTVDDGEQMSSSASSVSSTGSHHHNRQQQHEQQQQAQPGQEVYGRLVHYPHEIDRVDNSHGMARTLGKLRLLNQHSKQQQQQLSASSGDIVETNRIPLATDVDQMSDGDWRKLGESATDLARNNFVYGTVLLRPSSSSGANTGASQELTKQPNNHNQHNLRPPHHRPMSTLRELANEQERQRLLTLTNKGPPGQLVPDSRSPVVSSGQSLFVSPDDNLGRVHTSPPSDHSNNHDKSNLRQVDGGADGDGGQESHAATGGGDVSAPDELVNQQRAGQVAINEGGGAELVQAADNDGFEGEFHSGPLEQAEVRLLRSLDHHRQQQPQTATGTTSGANDKLAQQPQVELVTKRTEIVID